MKYSDIQFTEAQRDELLVDILKDTIMYENVIKAVDQLIGVYNRDAGTGEWDGDMQFSGLTKAYPLMGLHCPESIEEEEVLLPFIYKLRDIFYSVVIENERKKKGQRKNAEALAKHILIDWKEYMKGVNIP